jgi:hypothetical protein
MRTATRRWIGLGTLLCMLAEPVGAQEPLPPAPAPSEPPMTAPPPPPPTIAAPPSIPEESMEEMDEAAPRRRRRHLREPRTRRRKGLLIAGAATLGGSYLITAFVGLTLLSGSATPSGATCLNCESVGTAFLIPIAGPWIGLPHANSATGGQFVSALLGIAQAAGLALTVTGIVLFVTSGSQDDSDGLSLQLAPLPGGAVGSLRFAF